MFDTSLCSAMSLGKPQVSLEALQELRAILPMTSPDQSWAQIHLVQQRHEELITALADLLLEAIGAGLIEATCQEGGNSELEDHV
jgi:hypothetical protein